MSSTELVHAGRACSGVDISSYQGNFKWSTWTKKDKRLRLHQGDRGHLVQEPLLQDPVQGRGEGGLIRGAYHFANPAGKAGYLQARYFVKNGGGWSADGHTLPGVLDIEYNPYGSTCYGVSKKKTVKWVTSFTHEYKKLTGKDAVIYTTLDWWTQCTGNSSKFADDEPALGRPLRHQDAGHAARRAGRPPPSGSTRPNPIDQDVFPAQEQGAEEAGDQEGLTPPAGVRLS